MGVVQVVTREQAKQVFHGLDTTLGMHAVMLPLFRRQGLEQLHVRLAEHAEQREGFAGIPSLVVTSGNPRILIECLKGGPGAPRIARIRQLATISASARWARISATDHFPAAGRLCNRDADAPSIKRSSSLAVRTWMLSGSCPPT